MELGLVSVIMPAYNAARYLETAIASIREQTYSAFELVIIDDGSTDSTPSIIRSAMEADHRIKSIRHDTCLGLPRSLNDGLQLARGEWIARMDGDDICLPARFEKQIDFFRSNPAFGLVGTQGRYINDVGELQQRSDFPLLHTDCVQAILDGNSPFFHSSWMMTRACFERVGYYNPCLFSGEDKDFWLRASEQFQVGNIDFQGVCYRVHAEAFTTKTIRERRFFRSFIIDLYKQRKQSGIDYLGCALSSRWPFSTIDGFKAAKVMLFFLAANRLVGTLVFVRFYWNILKGLIVRGTHRYTWVLASRLMGLFHSYIFKSSLKVLFR